MKKSILYIVVMLCLFACQEKGTNAFVVKDKEALVTKIADMYFIEAYLARANKTDRDTIRKKMTDEFYDLYQMSVKDLDLYLDTIKEDKKLFEEIMDSVSVVFNKKNKKKK